MTEISDVEIQKIGDFLRGSPKEIYHALEALNLNHIDDSAVDVDDRLLDISVERCKHCEWWHDSHDLQYESAWNGGLCEQCCDENGIDRE